MESTVAEARTRWLDDNGAAMFERVLAQRFNLTPAQRVQVINNKSLVTDLAGIVLARRDLRDGMLLDVDMRAADCRGARMANVLTQCATLMAADFAQTQLDELFFWKSNASGAVFNHAELYKVTFEETRLADASFAGADLHGVRFHSLDLSRCNFDGARFTDCNFFDVRIDERYRAMLEAMGRGACRLSRITWLHGHGEPVS